LLIEFQGCEDLLEKVVNSEDVRGNTLLLLAIILQMVYPKNDYYNLIHLLLMNKADIRKANKYEWTPVEEAIFNVD
jgi:ankyrin repeat protein